MITRPEAKLKPYKKRQQQDLIQILPINSKKKLLLVELNIPNIGIKYRIIESYFKAEEDVEDRTRLLLKNSGLISSKIKLLKKGQPYNVGEYPQDKAVYIFVAEDTRVMSKPNLKILVPFSLKTFSVKEFKDMVKNKQVENLSSLLDLNFVYSRL